MQLRFGPRNACGQHRLYTRFIWASTKKHKFFAHDMHRTWCDVSARNANFPYLLQQPSRPPSSDLAGELVTLRWWSPADHLKPRCRVGLILWIRWKSVTHHRPRHPNWPWRNCGIKCNRPAIKGDLGEASTNKRPTTTGSHHPLTPRAPQRSASTTPGLRRGRRRRELDLSSPVSYVQSCNR